MSLRASKVRGPFQLDDRSEKSEIYLQSWAMDDFQTYMPPGFCFLSFPLVSLLLAETMTWLPYSL